MLKYCLLVGYFHAGKVEGVTAGAEAVAGEAVAVEVVVVEVVVVGSLEIELQIMPDVLNVVLALVLLATVKYHHLLEIELTFGKLARNLGSCVCTSSEKINSILLFVHIV